MGCTICSYAKREPSPIDKWVSVITGCTKPQGKTCMDGQAKSCSNCARCEQYSNGDMWCVEPSGREVPVAWHMSCGYWQAR